MNYKKYAEELREQAAKFDISGLSAVANEYRRATGAIEELLSADVAPVVRCKDCKHHYDCGIHFCDRLGMDCPDDSEFFCSYGARKGGEDDAENETN